MTELEQKALAALSQYELLHRGDRVTVGVSGGADSVALLSFLYAKKKEYDLTLTVCHVHHGLRGKEADEDEDFVRSLAAGFDLPFLCYHADAAARAEQWHCSTEEAGRRLRYEFFEQTAGETGLIATAHTLDDNTETVLLNLIRGTGLHGLCGIPRRRGNIIRPLLDVTRTEVEEYLAVQGFSYRTDSTNLTDDYTRNVIRHHILPQMTALNPAFLQASGRMAAQLTAQWQLTERLADTAQQELAAAGGELSRQGFLSLPEPVADRLLLRLLEQAGIPRSAAAVQRMRGAIEEGKTLDLAGRQWFLIVTGDTFRLVHRPQGEPEAVTVPPAEGEGEVILPFGRGKTVKLTYCYKSDGKVPEKFNNYPLKNALDCDKIMGNLVLRPRREGDRLQKYPAAPARRLGTLWGEAAVPALLRGTLAVIADDRGVLWAEELGNDHRAAVGPDTRRIVIIELLEEKQNENGQRHQ